MKANKKNIRNAILLTIAAIVLVVATVLTTLAYLISAASVSNTFTVGSVEIEMWETPVGSNGKKQPGAAKTSDGNSYHLLPGEEYDKDPTVYVKPGSSETLLYVLVQNNIFNLEYPDGDANSGKQMKEQMIDNGWVLLHDFKNHLRLYVYRGVPGTVITNGENTYTIPETPDVDKFGYVIPAIPSGGQKKAFDLFKTFTVNPNVTQKQISLAQGATVEIGAFAIQDNGLGDGTNGFITKADAIKQWNTIVANVDYLYDSHIVPDGTTGD